MDVTSVIETGGKVATVNGRLRVMLTGQMRRGKDTMASILQEQWPGLERAGFADALKLQTAMMLNWAIEHFDIPRPPFTREMAFSERDLLAPAWQWVGSELCRGADPDYWVKRFDALHGSKPNLVVTDCRFANEAAYGRWHGFTLVRITGPRRGEDGRDPNHVSERNIASLPVDLEYHNTGTLDDMRIWARDVLIPLAQRISLIKVTA